MAGDVAHLVMWLNTLVAIEALLSLARVGFGRRGFLHATTEPSDEINAAPHVHVDFSAWITSFQSLSESPSVSKKT